MFILLLYLGLISFSDGVYFGKYPSINAGYIESKYHIDQHQRLRKDDRLKISSHDLQAAVDFAKSNLDKLKRLEENIKKSHVEVKPHTPDYDIFVGGSPNNDAIEKGKAAFVSSQASLQLVNKFCRRLKLSKSDCVRHLAAYSLTETSLKGHCEQKTEACPGYDTATYRTIDGSCNRRDKLLGRSNTNYKRVTYPNYLDGISRPMSDNWKLKLPSPRKITDKLVGHKEAKDHRYTLNLMQWTQFISHDFFHTVVNRMINWDVKIKCCTSDGRKLAPRLLHPFCMPIDVPHDDKFYSKHDVSCMSYVRSMGALRNDCSFGPLEQMNQETHYIDASHVYGSENGTLSRLRTFKDGKLKVKTREDGKTYLPQEKPDPRVVTHPLLTAMHTVWVREHNRVADELRKVNPGWSDGVLFEESRRIVIAEIQHVTYKEWLPKIIEKKYMKMMEEHAIDDFSEAIDPRVTTSFSTAAMRYYKSLIAENIDVMDEERKVVETVKLRDVYQNGSYVEVKENIDGLLRSLSTEPIERMDLNIVEDATNYLHKGDAAYGSDIFSLDIQRGRDHGMPSYSTTRKLCSLPDVNSFNDLHDEMDAGTVKILQDLYTNPKEIDLIVGGYAEKPAGDSMIGRTFACIVADQFMRSKHGDRFFYTHLNQPKPFTNGQLKEIQKVGLAKIFCDNSNGIKSMQKDVFRKVADGNNLVACNTLPGINFEHWKTKN